MMFTRKLGIAVVLLLICIPVAGAADYMSKNEDLVEAYYKQIGIISNVDGNPDDAYSQVKKMWEIRSSIKTECDTKDKYLRSVSYELGTIAKTEELLKEKELKKCLIILKFSSEAIATAMLESAEFYATKDNKTAAKKVYREVITTFIGDAYRSKVKKAEFGLEDLKE